MRRRRTQQRDQALPPFAQSLCVAEQDISRQKAMRECGGSSWPTFSAHPAVPRECFPLPLFCIGSQNIQNWCCVKETCCQPLPIAERRLRPLLPRALWSPFSSPVPLVAMAPRPQISTVRLWRKKFRLRQTAYRPRPIPSFNNHMHPQTTTHLHNTTTHTASHQVPP